MKRVVFVSILIFGPNLGNMLNGTSTVKTGEHLQWGQLSDLVVAESWLQ